MTELSLRMARTEKQICSLPRDHYEAGDWCIMTDGGTVWIIHQKLGEPARETIAVPKPIFDRLFTAYNKPQKLRALPPVG